MAKLTKVQTMRTFSSSPLHFCFSRISKMELPCPKAFRSAEVQKTAREFLHGLDFRDHQQTTSEFKQIFKNLIKTLLKPLCTLVN